MDSQKTKKRSPPAKQPPTTKVAPKAKPDLETLPEPEPEVPSKRWPWAVVLLASTGLLAGTAYLALTRTLVGLELHVFRFINDWPDRLRGFFLVATMAPESLWIALAVVIVTFLLKMYRLAWQLAVATLGGYAAVFALKHVIARARPVELVQDVSARVQETGMGFPSAHTMIITIIVLLMWRYLPKFGRLLLLILIPIMALSRIYLGVHAPLDVIGGFALGVGVVACMRLLPRKMREFLHFD